MIFQEAIFLIFTSQTSFSRTYTYLMPTYGFAPAFPTDINSTNNSKSESSNGASNPSSKLPEDFVTSLVS